MSAEPSHLERRVLVLAPTAGDERITRRILQEARLPASICRRMGTLLAEVELGAGALVITDRSLSARNRLGIEQALAQQPDWSELPVLILCADPSESRVAGWALDALDSATILERPVRVTLLVSALRTALRARERQYQLRDNLRRLAESEESFRGLAETVPDIVFACHPDGTRCWTNARWRETTGATDAAVARWTDFVHSEDRERVVAQWARCAATGEPYSDEYRYRNASGKYLWVLSRAVALRDASGAVCRWVGTSTDITESKLAREALEQAARRKDEFIATLAHELRNPLAAISLATRLGAQAAGDVGVERLARQTLERQVALMVRLLDDLLDVSRLKRGVLRLERQPVDLSAVIDTAVELARPAIEAEPREFEAVRPSSDTWVLADPSRLAQAIGNLLINAAKYTQEGGRIVLRAAGDAQWASVEVEDNGVGIDADALERIFGMFEQATEDHKHSAGLGIGLSLARGVVELHGGTIHASSAGRGRGATFRLRLPAWHMPVAQDQAGEGATMRTGDNSALRVVVADDSADIADTLAILLRLSGHDVHAALDGREAVALTETIGPDVVLLDIGMPQMDGLEAARAIRRSPGGAGILLVAMTGWGQDADREETQRAGFDVHLVKPVEAGQIEELLATHPKLREAHARRDLHSTSQPLGKGFPG